MAQPVDTSHAAQKADSHPILSKIGSELVDFGEGLYHGAIESPINGVVQIADHVTGAQIPELHLVDEQRLSHSAGGIIGNIAGTAIDIYLASMATAGIAGAAGGSGMIGAALRFGAVGAAYTTVFQPTDAKSKHFFADRVENGGVALATFAAMGGAGAALDSTGMFAVSAARSLGGTLTYGGIVGTAGGLVHAEANAIKNGKAVPTWKDLAGDTLTYGAFGLAYAGAGYVASHINAPDPKTFTSDNAKVTVYSDKAGNPVRLKADVPSVDKYYEDIRVQYDSTKGTDGNWSTKLNATNSDGEDAWYGVRDPHIQRVQIDGSKASIVSDGVVREFNDGGAYVRTNVRLGLPDRSDPINFAKYNKTEVVNGVTTNRVYDSQMRLAAIGTQEPGSVNIADRADLRYDKGGNLDSVALRNNGADALSMYKGDNGQWKIMMNDQTYSWNGAVKVVPNAGPGRPEQVQFTAPGNGGTSTFDVSNGSKPAIDLLQRTSTFTPGAWGRPTVSVDASGQASITGGSSTYQTFAVNDKPVAAGQVVPIHPGDKVIYTFDEGDPSPDPETRTILWSKSADGTPILGTQVLKPGTAADFLSKSGGWKY